MRELYFAELYSAMARNHDIIALTGDLGYGGFDKIMHAFPDRFLNCGASEQSMLDIAVGLAHSNKIPICYTITPFFYRGWETIRTYINHENLNIKLVGSGRDTDYEHDGYSHNAEDVKNHFNLLKNIKQMWPEKKEEIPLLIREMIDIPRPTFLSLKR